MQPSSLIFVVIVGIWAAFFIQYWVRRREHIATARSVDAFTSTMRVLEVRDPLPQVEVSDRPRSYAVSPVRPARPQVTVKRAEAMLSVRDLQGRAQQAASTEWAGGRGATAPRAEQGERVAPRPSSGRSLPTWSGILFWRPSRAAFGLTLAIGLVATVVYAVLAVTGVLVAWSPAIPAALSLIGFLGVRADVRAGRNSGQHLDDGPSDHLVGAIDAGARSRVGVASQGRGDVIDRAPAAVGAEADVVPAARIDPREHVFDVSAATATPALENAGVGAGTSPAAAAGRRAVLVDDDDLPLTWDPVPVPRPTYTMKAQAPRVQPQTPMVQAPAGRISAGQATPRPMTGLSPVASDWDDDVPEAFPARRVAAG